MVRELLTSLGDPNDKDTGGPVAYALEGVDPKISAEKTAQRFMGLRIRCAQCHDHPFDVWTQDDYFGLAATFAKIGNSDPAGCTGMMYARRCVKIQAKGQDRAPPNQAARRSPAPDRPADHCRRG